MKLDFYQSDGSRNIVRHSLNQRKQLSVRASYKRSILAYGILEGCRGECWVIEPSAPGMPYQAITFGTLSGAESACVGIFPVRRSWLCSCLIDAARGQFWAGVRHSMIATKSTAITRRSRPRGRMVCGHGSLMPAHPPMSSRVPLSFLSLYMSEVTACASA